MYDLLTEQGGIQIDKVVVLRPSGELIRFGFDFINDALKNSCQMQDEALEFEDANSEKKCYKFLQRLYILLVAEQKNGDTVYLSLAGGRKNMSAIMALLVPLFPNVKSLYHVIDKNEASPRRHNFKSFEELVDSSEEDRKRYFFPDRDQLTLVTIPYQEQRVSDELRAILYNPLTLEILDKLWDNHPGVAAFIDRVQNPASQLKVFLTEKIAKNYQDMQNSDAFHAGRFATCFEYMKNPYHLKEHIHGSFSHNSLSFHFYKRRRTDERPFYHTEPQGIHLFPKAKVKKVIISGLTIEREGIYEPTAKMHLQSYDAAEPLVPLDANESVLLVPLGPTPMVATQFYTLRAAQGQTIREVVLLYPAGMKAVRQSAEMAKNAFEYENVACRSIEIPELEDIDSRKACEIYEKKLEETIDDIHERYSEVPIDLLLSGGRKGMAALAMFVAQRKGIRDLYHTLINDVKLNRRVEDETTVGALNKISGRERNYRLFLRAYEGEGPYEKFICFKIPILPGGKK